jgi:hypothetical protein
MLVRCYEEARIFGRSARYSSRCLLIGFFDFSCPRNAYAEPSLETALGYARAGEHASPSYYGVYYIKTSFAIVEKIFPVSKKQIADA